MSWAGDDHAQPAGDSGTRAGAWHEDPDSHPAARAWAEAGTGGQIVRIELLKERRKTTAYRLQLDGGRSIIAKLQPVEIVRRERAIYADLLLPVGLSVPDYLGSLVPRSSTLGWTFLADAGNEPFVLDDIEHRRMAAMWLARLHSQPVERARKAAALIHSTATDYLEKLAEARSRIAGWHATEPSPPARKRLGEALATLSSAESNWADMAREWDTQQAALVHGDFASRNVRIGRGADREHLLVFDWDMAATAVAAIDLWWMTPFPDAIEIYSYHVGTVWPAIDERTVQRSAVVGAALQAIDCLDWAAWDSTQWAFACDWVDDLAQALDALGVGVGR